MKNLVSGFIFIITIAFALGSCEQPTSDTSNSKVEQEEQGALSPDEAGASFTVSADGSADTFAPTTTLTLTFDQAITGLSADYIVIQADDGRVAKKGDLVPKEGNVYELAIDALLAEGPHGVLAVTVTVTDGTTTIGTEQAATLYAWIEIAGKDTFADIGTAEEYPLDGWYKQTADITITNADNWTPIGTENDSKEFKGTFDGNNYKITADNLTFESDFSFFGDTDGAALKNIHIQGSITLTEDSSYLAGIAIYAVDTSIINCTNAANLTSIAGATGICDTPSGTTLIDSCKNTGSIIGAWASGIVSYVADGEITIKNCSNTGTVTGTTQETGNGQYAVGGICSQFSGSGSIIACFNTGTVTSKSAETVEQDTTSEVFTGGIVGSFGSQSDSNTIIACYNTGDVQSVAAKVSDRTIHIGGITGYNTGTNNNTITASYSTGTLSFSGNGDGGGLYIGGISGTSQSVENVTAVITACYWKAGAANGIGMKDNAASDEGTIKFGESGAWPSTNSENGGHADWGTGDGTGSGKYWKSLGSSPSTYPKLWFES
jgi:hypothetical protein